MRKALEGIKVIQLANFIAAAESPKGDPIRYTQEQEGRPQNIKENVAWEYLNGNKRCISINTKTEEGKEALFKLLDGADVLLTNWRLGALQRAGLDYETLKERYPKLIYAMILGYGKTGPDKDLPGYDFTAFFGRGGYTQNLRRRGNDPITMIPGLGDNNVGLMLAMGIITALYNRETTGKGDFVTTSLYETAIFNMSMMLLGVQYDGQARKYPISIRQDLIDCGKYYPQSEMIANGLIKEFMDEIQKTFLEHDVKEMDEILRKGDIPHSIAYSWEDIMNDPQAHAVGAFYDVTCPNGVVRKATHTPVRLESEGEIDGRTAPMIGEQGREILSEIGYTDEKIDEMLTNGSLYIWQDKE